MYTATHRSELDHEMAVPLAGLICEPLAVGTSLLVDFEIFNRILFLLLFPPPFQAFSEIRPALLMNLDLEAAGTRLWKARRQDGSFPKP